MPSKFNRTFFSVLSIALTLLIAVACIVLAKRGFAAEPSSNSSSPVLVELFTSEGCSSCPPADALLRKLDGMQPVQGVQAIVLSEHVDYWNHDGWKDVYSSSFFTQRQTDYARRLSVREPYTPQLVMDGTVQMNGSDAHAVVTALEAARGRAKIAVRITDVSLDGKTLHLRVTADALPEDAKTRNADIFVAVALNHAESHVAAGENKGRDISHVAVVETINKVGTIERGKGKDFDRHVTLKMKTTAELAALRFVAFVQEPDTGAVVGATVANAPEKAISEVR
jgi:hypothetical protein